MSIETYELLAGKLELYRLLDEGMKAKDSGKVRPAGEVIAEIRQKMYL